MRAVLVAALLLLALQAVPAQTPGPGSAADLRARYQALRPLLEQGALRGPIHIESSEGARGSQGDAYAVLAAPFATVSAALGEPARWCDVLMLHLNTKACRSQGAGAAAQLELRIASRWDRGLAEASKVVFGWRTLPPSADFLAVQLDAPDGPFDTRDYRMVLEAVPLDGQHSFLHLGYAFQYGGAGKLALQLYLATAGRSKVGFTALAERPGAAPVPIGGVRGIVERNTMRYYLAIEAYFGALGLPPATQLDQRLHAWFDGTERYPRQLRELDRATYVDLKRSEIRRQQAAQ